MVPDRSMTMIAENLKGAIDLARGQAKKDGRVRYVTMLNPDGFKITKRRPPRDLPLIRFYIVAVQGSAVVTVDKDCRVTQAPLGL